MAFGIGYITILFRRVVIYYYRRYKRLPPGLYGVPYFGSMFTLIYHGADLNLKVYRNMGQLQVTVLANSISLQSIMVIWQKRC